MPDYEGNSDGSIYLGQDGNAYQVINGKSIQVSKDKLIVAGWKPMSDVIVGGRTYRNIDGNIFLIENNQLIPIIDTQQLLNLEKQMENEKATRQKYLIAGGVVLVLLFLLN